MPHRFPLILSSTPDSSVASLDEFRLDARRGSTRLGVNANSCPFLSVSSQRAWLRGNCRVRARHHLALVSPHPTRPYRLQRPGDGLGSHLKRKDERPGEALQPAGLETTPSRPEPILIKSRHSAA